MNSNQPNINSQINKYSQMTSISNVNNEFNQNKNISPINRISILKTEEQKEIVRTNVYEPNDSSPGNNQHFCVVTEIIRRSANISLEPQPQTFNNGPLNFSFGQNYTEQNMNQNSQNKSIKVHIADSEKSHYSKNGYKLLIKKIGCQLKNKVRTPTQGFFYFAFQKGNYPLMIIRKYKNKIINHSIELDNDIFKIFTQKYIKYKELIKRIAFLLRQKMKNPYFWKNNKYSSQNISHTENENVAINVTISKNNSNDSDNSKINKNIKSNKNNINNKSPDYSKTPTISNNNTQNIKNFNNQNVTKNQNNITTYCANTNNTNLQKQKKAKTQNNKTNNNFKSNINHPNINRNNIGIGSHKNNNFTNQINNNKEGKQINRTKKDDFINKNPFINQSQLNNKDQNKQINSNNTTPNNIIVTTVKTTLLPSTTNKNEQIINVNINNYNNKNNEKNVIENKEIVIDDNKNNTYIEETKNINKDDNFSIKGTIISNTNIIQNKDINLNIISTQSEPILYNNNDTSNDIEMKNNFDKINNDTIVDKKVNVFQEQKTNYETLNAINNNNIIDNNKVININNQNINNNLEQKLNDVNVRLNDDNSTNININKRESIHINIIPSSNTIKLTKNNTLNSSNISDKNEKRISISSIQKSGKSIKIRLSTFKKDEEKNNFNIEKSKSIEKNKVISTNTTNIANINNTNIDINSIKINNNNNLSEEYINYVNKFNDFLINNNLVIQFNIPVSVDIKGQNYLKQNIFWEKYVYYIYFNYLVNNNKISLFSFVQIIEQYFLWCENKTPEINQKFKMLIIDIVNKIYNVNEINQFLSMNKISNLDDLFKKYELFINQRNKKKSYIYGKEIEIKIDNVVECNCDLCQNEIACMNKMSEINKNLITNVNTDNFNFKGNNNNVKKENEDNNNKNAENKNKDIFSKSKTLYSFESVFQFIPLDKKENENENENKRNIIELAETKKEGTNKKRYPKKNSSSKKKNKNRSSSYNQNKKKENEKFLDVPGNTIDTYFYKENKNGKEEEKESDEVIETFDEKYENKRKKSKK